MSSRSDKPFDDILSIILDALDFTKRLKLRRHTFMDSVAHLCPKLVKGTVPSYPDFGQRDRKLKHDLKKHEEALLDCFERCRETRQAGRTKQTDRLRQEAVKLLKQGARYEERLNSLIAYGSNDPEVGSIVARCAEITAEQLYGIHSSGKSRNPVSNAEASEEDAEE